MSSVVKIYSRRRRFTSSSSTSSACRRPSTITIRLIRDDQGKRLAKRDDARALSKYRADGATPADIRRMVGLPNP